MVARGKGPDELPLRGRPVAEISGTLQDVLGQSLVAYAIRETDPATIGALARSEALPTEAGEVALRDLAEVTEALLETEDGSAEIVRAMMIGSNPNLQGQAVVELFHNGESARVVEVARQLGSD